MINNLLRQTRIDAIRLHNTGASEALWDNAKSMNISQYNSNHPNAQNGGALLVAMILIFMLSIMGISSMKGSTLERRMASNSIQTATTFQSAESTSELALNETGNLDETLKLADFASVNQGVIADAGVEKITIDMKQEIGLEAEAKLRFVGYGPAIGFSDTFAAYRFEVTGTAKTDAIGAEAFVTQGAYRIAPRPTL